MNKLDALHLDAVGDALVAAFSAVLGEDVRIVLAVNCESGDVASTTNMRGWAEYVAFLNFLATECPLAQFDEGGPGDGERTQ